MKGVNVCVPPSPPAEAAVLHTAAQVLHNITSLLLTTSKDAGSATSEQFTVHSDEEFEERQIHVALSVHIYAECIFIFHHVWALWSIC